MSSGLDRDNSATLEQIAAVLGDTPSGAAGIEELSSINRQIPDGRRKSVIVDLSIIRGLEYYTGPVFEVDLTFDLRDEKGRPVSVGSVGGGGRYDGLVKRFKGVEVPAVGISVGVSRLLAALELKRGAGARVNGPVVILALEKDRMADYQAMAAELRADPDLRKIGVRAEVYLGGANFAKQMKYADKRAAPVAVICGEDERAKGEVTIKDLVLGAELSRTIADNAEWREAQPAQKSVARGDLVAEVKRVLEKKTE
ncbi:MAG: ATP phosphoribosyltransferase regulatory subunit [Parvularculaceae bacterium]